MRKNYKKIGTWINPSGTLFDVFMLSYKTNIHEIYIDTDNERIYYYVGKILYDNPTNDKIKLLFTQGILNIEVENNKK